MGRLFWKFFFFFWLAQFVTAVGVGAMIWLAQPEPRSPGFGPPPGPAGFERPSPPPAGGGRPPPPPEARLMPPLAPLVAGSVVSLLFAGVLAWYFARPIRGLRGAFEAVAEGRLDTRVGGGLGRLQDELADLGAHFDRMAERLQKLIEGQRRLLHDVSHELRSPLARLQAAADLMRQRPERGAELAERIDRDTARMDRLIGELLALARLNSGVAGSMAEAVDMSELIHGIAEDAHFEAEQRGCRVEVDAAEPLVVSGNQDLLQRAIENVVRNALRHSPAGGCIAIAARCDAPRHELRIEVADEGRGVPEADLESIFAPFFRCEGAEGQSGYGLGLAIARRVMAAHRGSVVAANRPQCGLLVTLRLPLPAAT